MVGIGVLIMPPEVEACLEGVIFFSTYWLGSCRRTPNPFHRMAISLSFVMAMNEALDVNRKAAPFIGTLWTM
uniref:Secreted protein n=1 Tax=Echinococcus granulosus TaxID=6210 RepID=A0A068X5D0_ECHGR|nr:hypothetical protein EgrG_000008600 [Echinococcus granulosus]